MKLLTKSIRTQLEANAAVSERAHLMPGVRIDHQPVVKIFNPAGAATWLFTEIDGDICFGLCDLGMGSPELGSVSISELESIKGPLGIGLERDKYFTASMGLNGYVSAAREAGSIQA